MPWCPNCKMEYRDGFSKCADCLVTLIDERPEGADAPWRDPLKKRKLKKPLPEPRFPEFGIWNGLLVCVLFMGVYSVAGRLIGDLLFRTSINDIPFWISRSFGIDIMLSVRFFWWMYSYILNLVFFCGVFFILNRQNLFGYLIPRNIAINAAFTIGMATVLDLAIGNASTFGSIEFGDWFRIIGALPTILALALIYRFTIGGLPFKKLFFTKIFAGVLVLSALFIVAQLIEREISHSYDYIYTTWGTVVTFLIDPIEWLFRLHLLWVGIIFRQMAKVKQAQDYNFEQGQ